MAADVENRFYTHVARYTTSAFMRLKLGDALLRREVAPHIFESSHEAYASVTARTQVA
jgi:propionate CoA-transferase